jgi:hypothetical protein
MDINMVNTHGLEWDSDNGLERGSPPGLYYGYIMIDSEIIKHVIITNLEVLADDITL